jgi:hypothetical protein
VTNVRYCGSLAYSNNEHAKQLLCVLDDHVWGMKITADVGVWLDLLDEHDNGREDNL